MKIQPQFVNVIILSSVIHNINNITQSILAIKYETTFVKHNKNLYQPRHAKQPVATSSQQLKKTWLP